MPSIALTDQLSQIQEDNKKSLWEGPSGEGPNGGVTQSMLNKFLECRERFRIRYVEGFSTSERFSVAPHYGDMWHAAEEGIGQENPWAKLEECVVSLSEKYPLDTHDVVHWYNILMLQFKVYQEYWADHEDEALRQVISAEGTFDVLYPLPSGRVVRLRGKRDSVDLFGQEIWLRENKTKGDMDPSLLQRQLQFDLQTMFYLLALVSEEPEFPVAGVKYNVIRRPLSGGKGGIRHKKNQSLGEFYEELKGIIEGATGPDWGCPPGEHFFFARWDVEVTPEDLESYKVQFLNPVLEQLCDWWEHIEGCIIDELDPFLANGANRYTPQRVHFRMPYGVYSGLMNPRVRKTELDEYLATGDNTGLVRAESLFRELQ